MRLVERYGLVIGNWECNKCSVAIGHMGMTTNSSPYASLNVYARFMIALTGSNGWSHLAVGDNVEIHKWYSMARSPAGMGVN